MARLNIDERWWIDPRRETLIERIGQVNTDGTAIKMWRLAQEYFRNTPVIPEHIYFACKFAKEFLEVGLAEKTAEGIYIKGSKEFFRWIKESQESGRRGGQQSAKRDRDEQGRLKPTDAQGSSKGNPSESEVSQPSSSSSSSPSSSGGEGERPPPPPQWECLWPDPDLAEFLGGVPIAGQRAWVKMVGTRFLIEPELHKARSQWLNVGSKVNGDTVVTFVNRWLNRVLDEKRKPISAADGEATKTSSQQGDAGKQASPYSTHTGANVRKFDEDGKEARANPADPDRVRRLVDKISGRVVGSV